MKLFLISFILLSWTTNALSDIKKEDLQKLESGETVLYKEKVSDNVWPRLKLYTLIEATPLESLAIFLALDHQKNYLPGILKSTPIKHVTATEVHTEYEMDLPWPLSNSHYIHGSNFEKLSKHNYVASWYMVKSDSAYKVDGSVSFTIYQGKTLMSYETLIKPKSALSGIVRGFMVKDTISAIESIKKEIVRTKKEDLKLLKKYISYINQSLNGKFVYQIEK